MSSIEDMRAFAAVAASLSFTKGAERLGISNKAIGKQVARLEVQLGQSLLTRTTRSVVLTDAGRTYLDRLLPVLDEIDAMEAAVRSQEVALTGRLRLSAPLGYGRAHLVGLIAEFRDEHPELTIELRLTDRYVDLVAEGIDVAVRIGSLDDSSLVVRRVGEVELWTVAGPRLLLEEGAPEHPHDLRGRSIVQDLNLRGGSHWPFTIDGREEQVRVDARLNVGDPDAACDLAVRNLGFTCVPNHAAAELVKSGRLVRVLQDYQPPSLPVHLVYPAMRHVSPKTRAFSKAATKALRP